MQNDSRLERLESMTREELVATALDLIARSPDKLIEAALLAAMHSANAACNESA